MKNHLSGDTQTDFGNEAVLQRNPDMAALLTFVGEARWNATFRTYIEGLFEASGMDVPTRYTLMTALMALRGWEAGVRYNAGLALDAGVPADRLRGAILCTFAVGGVSSAATGLMWLQRLLDDRPSESVLP